MLRRSRGRRLTTLLFTDIVGSSEIAVELGDDPWQWLLSRQRALIRRQLKQFGGREVDTAGDGFFAVFDEAAQGVRCACAIVKAVRDLGLEVRSGLHLGEVEREGGYVGGIAVHTAARVSAAAGAGEVLVTGTLADVVAGSGLEFADRGTRPLKGVPGEWHLFAVAAVNREPISPPVDPTEATRIRERLVPQEPQVRRRGAWYVAITGAAALSLLAGLILVSADRSPPPPGPSSGEELTGLLLAKIPLDSSEAVRFGVFDRATVQAGPIVVEKGHVWLGSSIHGPGIISRHTTDLTKVRTDDGTAVFSGRYDWGCSALSPCLTAARGLVWMAGVTSAQTRRSKLLIGAVNPLTNEVASRPHAIHIGGQRVQEAAFSQVAGLAYGDGSLWTAVGGSQTLYRIDLRGRRIGSVSPIEVGGSIDGLAYGTGALWVIDRLTGTLTRVDSTTNTAGNPSPLSGSLSGVVVGNGFVWVTDETDNALLRVDPELERAFDSIPVGRRPVAVTVGGGLVWVANFDDGTVMEVDPTSASVVESIQVAPRIRGLAYGAGALWAVTGSDCCA